MLRENNALSFIEDVLLVYRKAYRTAAGRGQSVTEIKPRDDKAINEFLTLYRHLFDVLKMSYSSNYALWALEQTTQLFTEMQPANPELKGFTFLNKAEPRGPDNAEAAEVLRENNALSFIEGCALGLSEGISDSGWARPVRDRDKASRRQGNQLISDFIQTSF